MRRVICVAFLLTLGTGSALAQQPSPHPAAPALPPNAPAKALTLQGAVQLAETANPALRESVEKINQAQTEVPIARAAILPNVTGVAEVSKFKDATIDSLRRFGGSSYDQYNTGIRLSQPLFQYGAISAIQAVKQDVRISQVNAAIDKRDLVGNVIKAYYQMVLSARNVDTLSKEQKISKETVDLSGHLQKIGRAQLLDSLQAKTQLELVEGQLSVAQNNLQIATANLANLLGEKVASQQFAVTNSFAVPQTNPPTKDAKAEPNPELQIIDLSTQKIDYERDALLGQNLPNLSLQGNYNFTAYSSSDLFDDRANSWSVTLMLTVPLSSLGFSYPAQRRSLASQQSQLVLERENTNNGINYQQVTSQKNLDTARDSIQTGTEGLKLATASSNEARRNYRLGTIDLLHYLAIQQAQVQAEQTLNAYKYNYISALADYYVSFNQDMEQLVGALDTAGKNSNAD